LSINRLNSGNYKFDAVQEMIIDGQIYEIWTAGDDLLIEALTMLLKEKYSVADKCSAYHLKGQGFCMNRKIFQMS
jgi:hypothetical protein